MPKPNPGEDRGVFIERCMGDSESVSDFPDQAQRFAVCESFWTERTNQEDIGNMSNGEQVRVNIRHRVNQDMISFRGEGDQKEMVIRSIAAKDESILNGILYTRNELDDAMQTLDRTPAPLGHPMDDNGDFLSALDVQALNGYYFGAYNQNPRRDGDRIIVDKVINVKRARENEMGRRVLDAINQGEPIHTSTGLLCNIEDCAVDGADFTARNILFDHDAILLDEPGAATPEQGIGMMVNKALNSDGGKINVINSEFSEMMERDVDMLGMELMRAVSRREDASTWERVKSAVFEALGLAARETETEANEESGMTDVTKEQFDELSAKVNGLAEQFEELDLAGALTEALEPITEKINGIVNKQNEEVEAKRNSLVERVINKNLLDEEAAKATPVVALEALLANSESAQAPFIGGFPPASASGNYELPED